jgi:hypothetical protein
VLEDWSDFSLGMQHVIASRQLGYLLRSDEQLRQGLLYGSVGRDVHGNDELRLLPRPPPVDDCVPRDAGDGEWGLSVRGTDDGTMTPESVVSHGGKR